MPEKTAYLRLNPEALRHFPEMNYTLAGVPGRGVVTLTARDPVLIDAEGKCLGVPESFVRAAGLHKENVEPRDIDGALVNRIPRFKIATTPFVVPKATAAAQEDVFNAAGDTDSEDENVFNAQGDTEDLADGAEVPRASAAPSGNAPRNGGNGGKKNRTSGAPDPTALP